MSDVVPRVLVCLKRAVQDAWVPEVQVVAGDRADAFKVGLVAQVRTSRSVRFWVQKERRRDRSKVAQAHPHGVDVRNTAAVVDDRIVSVNAPNVSCALYAAHVVGQNLRGRALLHIGRAVLGRVGPVKPELPAHILKTQQALRCQPWVQKHIEQCSAMTKSKGVQKPGWATRRLEVRAAIAASRFEEVVPLTESWWKANVGGAEATIQLRCSVCQYVTPGVRVRVFAKTKTANCWCGGGARWDTEYGRLRLCTLLRTETKFEPIGALLNPIEWPKSFSGGANTFYIPIRCTECKFEPPKCTISNMLGKRSADCNCRWKTQRQLREFLADFVGAMFPGWVDVKVEGTIPGVRSRQTHGRQQLMPYDALIVNTEKSCTVLAIELDGIQHFTDGRLGSTAIKNKTTMENDLDKEIGAVNSGVPLLRIFQDDVWNNRIDWKRLVVSTIEAALQGDLAVKVHRQLNQPLYWTGKYAALRVGSIVEVCRE